MFQVQLTNFGTYLADKFNSFEQAVLFAKSKGFEATIHDNKNGGVAGCWHPINGVSKW